MEDTMRCSSGEISVEAAIMAGGAVAVVAVVVVCAEPALPDGAVAAVEGAVEGVEGGVAEVLSFATAGPLSFFSPPPPPPPAAALPAAASVGSSFEARMNGMYTNPPMYGTSTSGMWTPSLS